MIWYQTFKCLSTTFLSFLSSRATRIRTLKWRSQSPLPYHLAIALYEAQGVGFEPTRPCGQTVFKTASLWPLRYPCMRAGDGNRTHVSSLEGWCSTIELHPHVVGVTGFEPATSWSQTRRSSQAEPHPDMLFCRFVFVASPKRLRYNITLFHTCQHFFTFFWN